MNHDLFAKPDPPALVPAPDSDLCRPHPASAYLRHDWGMVKGRFVCKRCGRPVVGEIDAAMTGQNKVESQREPTK